MKKFMMTKFNICFFLVFGLIGLTLLTTAFGNTDAVIYVTAPTLPPKQSANKVPKENDVNFMNSATSKTVPYSFFENGYFYDSQGATKELFYPEQNIFIRRALISAARNIGSPISKFEFGNYRLLCSGLEFQFFFKGINESVSRKVSLVQRFAMQPLIKETLYSNTKDVNVIIPIQGRLDTLKLFLNNFVKNVLPVEPHLILTIVYFKNDEAYEAKTLFDEKQKSSPLLRGSFVLVEDSEFSRGKGLRIGINHAAKLPFQLVFFCDVDIIIKPTFFKRCRANAIQYRQVYYPIVFSLYNPKVVYGIQSEKIPPTERQFAVDVDSNHGFWRHFGYGMACMYRSEFDTAGGMLELRTWGGEDEQLFNNIVSLKSIKPIRSPETGLFHMFHVKNCDHLGGSTYISCIRSKAANEGNQMQLGLVAIKLQEGIDIEGALYSWKIEYERSLTLAILIIFIMSSMIIFKRWNLYRQRANKIKKFKTIMGN